MTEDRKQSSEFRDRDEPVSLAPLDPEDALRALLAVTPPERPPTGRDDAQQETRDGKERPMTVGTIVTPSAEGAAATTLQGVATYSLGVKGCRIG